MQPELQSILYSPEEIERMSRAFEGAWDALVQAGSVYAQPYKADSTRERLALKVIDLIRQSTLDAEQLQFEALVQLEFITPSTPRMSPAFFENAGALLQSHPGEPR